VNGEPEGRRYLVEGPEAHRPIPRFYAADRVPVYSGCQVESVDREALSLPFLFESLCIHAPTIRGPL
jgi:hypothetical protein